MTKYSITRQVVMSGGIYDQKYLTTVEANTPKTALLKAIKDVYRRPITSYGKVFYVNGNPYIICLDKNDKLIAVSGSKDCK